VVVIVVGAGFVGVAEIGVEVHWAWVAEVGVRN
jgi:hypothetical protein